MRKLRKAGVSLRRIADETSLTLATVHTIVGSANGTDRTTISYLSRIDPKRVRMKHRQAKKQTRGALPKRFDELRKTGDQPVKEARGPGRA
jgi:hypothetical protein